MKTCKYCFSNDFYSNGRCKPCTKARVAKWQTENPHKRKITNEKYYINNMKVVKDRNAKYRASNLEKETARHAKYRAENMAKEKERHSKYYQDNKYLGRIYHHNRRAKERLNGGNLSKGLSAKLCKLQKGKCACCMKFLSGNYHLDHVMPIALGGENSDRNIQLLCQQCNQSKHAKHPVDFMRSRGFLL